MTVAGSMYLRRVSERTVEGVLADPARIRKVLFPSSSETVIDDEVLLSLGDSYQYLAHALPPLAALTTAGQLIGDVVIGDEPARGFTSSDTRKLAGKLAPISRADVVKALATVALPPAAPSIDELGDSFANLREFIVETAKAEAGMIIYVG